MGPTAGEVHPELVRRGVSEFSCFDVPARATVSELMAQTGSQDIDPDKAAALEPIFDMEAACIRNFDHDKFQRDGYWIWDGIWLPAARKKLIAAMHRAQRLDDMYSEGYREKRAGTLDSVPREFDEDDYEYLGWENVDWEGLGLQKPQRYRTCAELERVKGGGQLGAGPPPGTGYHGHQNAQRVPVMKGYSPESLVAGYEPYILFCLSHPQMIMVHKLMLGPEVRMDHNTLLYRKEGFPGQNWHSHGHHEAIGKDLSALRTVPPGHKDMHEPLSEVVSLPDQQNDLGLVRTLIYPDGFRARGDGGLKIVPGGHLERCYNLNESGWATQQTLGSDAAFREGWLKGRRHR